ncbi:MAG: sensor histidine kinase [Salinivirgaceae bacterium]
MTNSLPKIRKMLFFVGAGSSFAGNLVDVFLNQNQTLGLAISLFCLFIVAFTLVTVTLRKLSIKWGNGLILYSVLLNVFLDLITEVHNPAIDQIFYSNAMLLGLIILYSGFTLGKIHANMIGISIYGLIWWLTLNTGSVFLKQSIPMLTVILMAFLLGINLIIRVLESYHRLQQRLIIDLKSRNRVLNERKNYLNKVNQTKDKLFSVMAHDLRSPLTSIMGFTSLLEESLPRIDEKEARYYLSMVNNSAQKINTLLEDLLDWGRIQTGQVLFNPQETNLSALINEVKEYLEGNAALKLISLTSNVDDDLMIVADKNMMQAVIRNLLSNAIKFTHRKGSVNISAIKLHKQIQITVTDTGVGMNQETLENLFTSIAVDSKAGTLNEKGSGLGLLVCREYVEIHKGIISATSVAGESSVFTVLLPV